MQLEPREVRTQTEVRSVPECQMGVGATSDIELERMREDRLVAIRRRVQQDQPVPLRDGLGTNGRVARRGPEEVVQRGHPPDQFLDGAGHPIRLLPEQLPLFGVIREDPQPVGDHRSGGLGAAGDEQAGLVQQATLGVPVTVVHPGVRPHRDQVVGRAGSAGRHDLAQQRHEFLDRGPQTDQRVDVVGRGVEAHDRLGPVLHVVPTVLGKAEQHRDEPAGERGCERLDDLDLTLHGDRVEQLVDGRSQPRLMLASGARGEPAGHQAALLLVRRIVHGDDVDLFGCPPRPVPAARQEGGAVALDLGEVCVARDGPQRVLRIAVHGFVGPHPGEGRMRIDPVELGIEQVDLEPSVAAVLAGAVRAHAESVSPPTAV